MSRIKSTMKHDFSRVPSAEIQRSSFDRSCGHKTTFDAGYLVPIYCDEALPGDTFKLNMTCFGRMSTPIFPIMDNVSLSTFFFAIPIRLLWENWERFNGAQDDPGDSTDFLIPTMTAPASGGHAIGSISDYFGIPTGIDSLEHSALWHRGYNLVWNEFFRDQNLQDSLTVNKGDGPDVSTDYTLQRRGKRHDYFTSCLPWPQKGTAVTLPLGSSAPVYGNGKTLGLTTDPGNDTFGLYTVGGGSSLFAADNAYNVTLPSTVAANNVPGGNTRLGVVESGESGLYADLSAATAGTVNQFRQAFQVQRMYERDARGGTRYIEILKSHFNVQSPDSRLQRPEYLGGSVVPINIHPIAQTSSTDATTPQGNLSAFGTVSDRRSGFTKSFVEHSIIIGLVSVNADLSYQQGLDRMFSRSTRFDFFWPALAHLGEQPVLAKEIYAQGTAADDDVCGNIS